MFSRSNCGWIRISSRRIPGRQSGPGAGVAGDAQHRIYISWLFFRSLYTPPPSKKSVQGRQNGQLVHRERENSPRLIIRNRGGIVFLWWGAIRGLPLRGFDSLNSVRQLAIRFFFFLSSALPSLLSPAPFGCSPRSNPSIWETKTKFKGSTEVASRALIHGSCGACQATGGTVQG